MRNKSVIISLAVIIAFLSIFYLSFTFVAIYYDLKANDYARTEKGIDLSKKQDFYDSLWNQPIYLGFTMKEVKEFELNLGLDLQGGMNVVLEVSPVDIIKALSNNSQDEAFLKALEYAAKEQRNSQKSFTTLFFENFKENAPNVRLAEIFASSANQDRNITFNSTDEEVQKVIESEVNDAIDRAFEIIKNRIDKFGVSNPNIQRIQGTGRIQVELPGVDNPARVRKLLQNVAQLEFLEVYSMQDFSPFMEKMNDLLVKREKAKKLLAENTANLAAKNDSKPDTTKKTSDELFVNDNTKKEDSQTKDSTKDSTQLAQNENLSDLYRLMAPQIGGLFYSLSDTNKINKILEDKEIKALLPNEMLLLWGKESVVVGGKAYAQLFVLKKPKKAKVTGEVITDARPTLDQFGRPAVTMSMNAKGTRDWKKMTGENLGKQIAVVLDNIVYTAPTVQAEIDGGRSEITGNFTMEEAKDLANILKAGKLPAPTRIVEEVVVGPSLGLEAQSQGLTSVLVGLALVIIFMIAYYAKAGLIANVALFANIFFVLGLMAQPQLGAALTLPGIAGIVLTMGMAVDANVLIFERIREELRNGSTLTKAIELGYDRAFWTIFDSNLTTLLTALLLFVFGAGPIKGFAVTLMIGIICSFFTAVYISKVIIYSLVGDGQKPDAISFETNFSKKLFLDFSFDFMGKRKLAYIVSSVIIVVGWVLIFIQGLNYGVDFKGGRSYIVAFNEPIVPSDLQVALANKLQAGVEVKTYGNDNTLKVTTAYLAEDESSEADEKVAKELLDGIAAHTSKTLVKESDNLTKENFKVLSTAKVGSTIVDDIKNSAVEAGLYALIAL
ncbi:MAG: protein translocase subunit SecD, partial [Flammeovirgaceae bacterium]|nr:protein translocase subunit SecD [Flammeovirgaceae bacterium]MDW8287270.1 protein translocase subunit SecD [Flammeovirgaceae bacterium]